MYRQVHLFATCINIYIEIHCLHSDMIILRGKSQGRYFHIDCIKEVDLDTLTSPVASWPSNLVDAILFFLQQEGGAGEE